MELKLSLPGAKGVLEADTEGEVPRADPVPFKGPPTSVPPSLASGYAIQSVPAAVPTGTAPGVLSSQASSSGLPGSPPPAPPFPIMPHARLPDGATLPPVGSNAAEEELNKRRTWLLNSAPNTQGIIRPKPEGADRDFRDLIPSFLAARGLTKDKLQWVGFHEGWLEYRLMQPLIKSPGAQRVVDKCDDQTKWPKDWIPAYHGGRWYGFWNTVTEGWIHISKKSGVGMQAGGGDGHYCAVDMEYARWFSRPHVLFGDGAYHRVMYRVAYDRQKLRRKRFVSAGTEHVIWDGGIVVLSVLMHSNYPPSEHTEERFRDFDPGLETHPRGLEDVEVAVVTNTLGRV